MPRLLLLLFIGLNLTATLPAQNLNTTFRAKMTFPGQTLANVWGYTVDGKEYALVGGSLGIIIVDITNPDAPQQIVQIPGPNSLWKEIKTYSHYAYVVSEGGQGIQVVDLSGLPSPNLTSHFYRGDGAIANQLDRIHALHIDVSKGFLYAWGGNLFGGGAKIFDLKQDPYNPVYVGKYDQLGYIHDGFVENDTMYSGHIYAGQFAIVDMTNKNAPQLLATQRTPDAFTHNTWPSDDRRTLFTTDEVQGSFLAAFDISDPLDIRLLDKIQSNPGSYSIVHNTYVLGNYALTSWYKDGFTIVDITRPDNLVQVGNYDTYPGSGGGFEGAWGVYPYFPSGNIIVSNIRGQGNGNGELWIITPSYQRGCYLEGRVTDAKTGFPINGARIEVLNASPAILDLGNSNGFYKVGQASTGTFMVTISKRGYDTVVVPAIFVQGVVTVLDVALNPTEFTVSGTVLRQSDNQPVEGATVKLSGAENYTATPTTASGAFSIAAVKPGTYQVLASAPGLGPVMLPNQWINSDSSFTFLLPEVFRRADLLLPTENACNAFIYAENPFTDHTTLHYETAAPGSDLTVYNSAGQLVQTQHLEDAIGQTDIGQYLPNGLYVVRLEQGGKILQTIRLVKSEQ